VETGHARIPLLKAEVAKGRYIIIYLDSSESHYSFRAGKHATLSLSSGNNGNFDIRRIFSISSSPNRSDVLRFATEIGDSDFKKKLAGMKPGEQVDVSPPLGGFFLISDRQRPVIFITSGIGITPVASIVNWCADEGIGQRICLVYINKNSEEELFMEELEGLASRLKNFSIVRITTGDSDESPSLTFSRVKLDTYAPDIDTGRAIFYVSGKPRFVHDARNALLSQGIASASIKTEKFSGY